MKGKMVSDYRWAFPRTQGPRAAQKVPLLQNSTGKGTKTRHVTDTQMDCFDCWFLNFQFF